mmetsp:Transcript_59003/g.104848  ORF Transcript_59003/g.104848 Transcript_59003/m.104848 type:complete len:227 (-) Transcript_59003:232-912(-)
MNLESADCGQKAAAETAFAGTGCPVQMAAGGTAVVGSVAAAADADPDERSCADAQSDASCALLDVAGAAADASAVVSCALRDAAGAAADASAVVSCFLHDAADAALAAFGVAAAAAHGDAAGAPPAAAAEGAAHFAVAGRAAAAALLGAAVAAQRAAADAAACSVHADADAFLQAAGAADAVASHRSLHCRLVVAAVPPARQHASEADSPTLLSPPALDTETTPNG